MKSRLSKEEALSFLLTHIVVERQHTFEMNQVNLFNIMSLASQAEEQLNQEDGVIPHEVIEVIATSFIEK
jgi:hypothetical protein